MAKKTKKQRSNSGREKGYANLKGNTFRDKPERINKSGRPPKLVHHIVAELKAEGYEPVTEGQIIDAYQALMQLPEKKVKDIQGDKNKPFFLRLVAKWLQSDRGMEMLDRVMDRSFGKVMFRQSLDVGLKAEQPLFPDVVTTTAADTAAKQEGAGK